MDSAKVALSSMQLEARQQNLGSPKPSGSRGSKVNHQTLSDHTIQPGSVESVDKTSLFSSVGQIWTGGDAGTL
jgi:hypothetical protein